MNQQTSLDSGPAACLGGVSGSAILEFLFIFACQSQVGMEIYKQCPKDGFASISPVVISHPKEGPYSSFVRKTRIPLNNSLTSFPLML